MIFLTLSVSRRNIGLEKPTTQIFRHAEHKPLKIGNRLGYPNNNNNTLKGERVTGTAVPCSLTRTPNSTAMGVPDPRTPVPWGLSGTPYGVWVPTPTQTLMCQSPRQLPRTLDPARQQKLQPGPFQLSYTNPYCARLMLEQRLLPNHACGWVRATALCKCPQILETINPNNRVFIPALLTKNINPNNRVLIQTILSKYLQTETSPIPGRWQQRRRTGPQSSLLALHILTAYILTAPSLTAFITISLGSLGSLGKRQTSGRRRQRGRGEPRPPSRTKPTLTAKKLNQTQPYCVKSYCARSYCTQPYCI